MIKSFFAPKSVAVLGASTDQKKLGTIIVNNLKNSGYKGRIYPVNDKADENTFISDLKAYPILQSIHETPDLVIVSLPAPLVFEELMKSYAQGVRNFVVISAGFKEIGDMQTEKMLQQFLSRYPDVSLLGPNCLGFMHTQIPINASFAASFPLHGNISFFSQSGALCTAILDWSEKISLGFMQFVSLGNKNNLTENNFLSSDIISDAPAFFYLESFSDGKKFVQQAQKLNTPVIVLHPGKHKEATDAMKSHTGALASDSKIVEAALSEAGVIQINGLQDMMDLMMLFHFYPIKRNIKNLAIVSNAGGMGVITTDFIKDYNMNLATLSSDTTHHLSQKLPRTANIHNPIDVVGDALADRYGFALDLVLADSQVDAVIVLLTPQAMTEIDKTADYIQRLAKMHNKVVVASFMGGKKVDLAEKYLFHHGIPYFDYPERAVWALSKLKISNNKLQNENISTALKYNLAELFLMPQECEITGCDDLEKFLPNQEIALKLISDQMWHKTDSGGVILHLKTIEDRNMAFENLKTLGENISYKIQAQQMLKLDYELFLGAKRDINFGNVVVFGIGGIFTDILNESLIFLEFCNKEYIIEKIKSSKIYKMLEGARGKLPVSVDEIAEKILFVHEYMRQNDSVKEMDINPLGVVDGKIYAIDIKIRK